jgi:ubiquinone/menaquinone biosynthesis C-methylase UbiE
MEIKNLTKEDIFKMDYNQLIGLTKETNRIPGGKKTIFEILNKVFVNRDTKILEIGTSTGFTSIEISRLVKCAITSIDINQMSLDEAKNRALNEGFDNIKFIQADVNELPFQEGEFDLVIIGNVFSLMIDKERALKECRRVCKKTGFLAVVPLFYLENPSDELIQNVSNAIHVNITPYFKQDWINFFNLPGIEIFWSEDYSFDYMNDDIIKHFVKSILEREHLKELNKDAFEELKNKYTNYMYLFRENLSKMGFSIILLANIRLWEDPELYTSRKVKNEG